MLEKVVFTLSLREVLSVLFEGVVNLLLGILVMASLPETTSVIILVDVKVLIGVVVTVVMNSLLGVREPNRLVEVAGLI